MRSRKTLSRFVAGMFLFASIVCFDCFPLGYSLAQSNDENAIRSLVRRIFELYQQKDLNGLVSLWSEKSPFLAQNKLNLEREFTSNEKIALKGFEIRKMRIEREEATLRVAADLVFAKAKDTSPTEKIDKKNREIHLMNEGGIWKVWKFISSEEELALAIIAVKTEEERNALMEREPDLITSDLVNILNDQSYALFAKQGRYQQALEVNQLAFKLAEQMNDKFHMAQALFYKGSLYSWGGNPDMSYEVTLECYRKSLKIAEEFGFKNIITIVLIRTAVIYSNLGELSKSKEHYRRAIKLCEELGYLNLNASALRNLGIIYHTEGNYAKALGLLLKSLEISESIKGSHVDRARSAGALISIGAIFKLQGNIDQALDYYQRAYEVAEKGVVPEDHSAKVNMARALIYTGIIYMEQGKHSLALEYFQKSLKLIEALGDDVAGYDITILPEIKMSIGNALSAGKDKTQAITYHNEALKLTEKGGNKRAISGILLDLSNIYLSQKDYREALSFAEQSLKLAEQTNQFPFICQALVNIAKAYSDFNQTGEARQALARAIDIVEHLREQLAGGELERQHSFENAVTPYQEMIDLEIGQKRFKEAFSYAQRAKGRTLLELLQKGRESISKSISPAEREREQQLSKKIVSFNRQVTDEKLKSRPDNNRLGELEAQLKKARLEFEAFKTTLYASHPELKVQRGEIHPISFDNAAGLIPDTKTAILDFIVTDENVHLFVLTNDTSAGAALNTYTVKIERKLLGEKVEGFRRQMADRGIVFKSLSQELYGLLLKPAEKQLQNKTSLVISPDGPLWDLPFQVLQAENSRFLIEDAAISYAPSLSVLREMQLVRKKKQAPAPASLLALGNPLLGKENLELGKIILRGAELPPLPEASREVQALATLYGKTRSKVHTGPAAREEIVKQESKGYRILHLATHGILNDVSPMYSNVMLSQAPGKSDEDGLLEAWEIMNLDLDADLVVLSACETARGRVSAGEGMIGLNWALFVAGCPRTVVSQWKVNSVSTAELMVEFHKGFKTRFGRPQAAISTAEALRQAALKLKQNPKYSHPYYWGGFVVVGDGS